MSPKGRVALSASEAASVTGVPLKQVHRIVDAGLLEGAIDKREGARVILDRGLVGLKLAHETAELLTPEVRRRLVQRLLRQPEVTAMEEKPVTVDLRPLRAAVRRGLGRLEEARRMVTVDQEVLGGTPCFTGTRIPVHDIAAMVANGEAKEAILVAYPQLAAEQIELALVYAAAYPRRGRPRRLPSWRDERPISAEEVLLPGPSRAA